MDNYRRSRTRSLETDHIDGGEQFSKMILGGKEEAFRAALLSTSGKDVTNLSNLRFSWRISFSHSLLPY
jgi:hypothetical protein